MQNLAQGKNPPGIEEVRARYAALFARFGASPAAMDFTPGQLGPIQGEWVGALGGPGRTLLYFHGGGFVAGSPETHRPLVGKLVEASGISAFWASVVEPDALAAVRLSLLIDRSPPCRRLRHGPRIPDSAHA